LRWRFATAEADPTDPQPDLAVALADALALDDHTALREASNPEVLRALIAAYGGAGSPPLLAALAAGNHAALRTACARDDRPDTDIFDGEEALGICVDNCNARRMMVRETLAAYGGRGNAALSAALAAVGAGCLLSASRLADAPVLEKLVHAYGGAGSDALVAALCTGVDDNLGQHVSHAALLSIGDVLNIRLHDLTDYAWLDKAMESSKHVLVHNYGERGVAALVRAAAAEGGEELDAFLCAHGRVGYLFVSLLHCPGAWRSGSGGRRPLARRLLSPAHERLALPVLCALRRLPIAGPMMAFLRERPWLLYAAVNSWSLRMVAR
jgi:hypothetical protein